MARRASSSTSSKDLVSKGTPAPRAARAAAPAPAAARKGSAVSGNDTAAKAPSRKSDKDAAPSAKPAVSAATATAERGTARKASAPAGVSGNGVADGAVAHVAVKGSKDGISWTKDFDLKFLTSQRSSLLEQRTQLVGQASRLEDEANALIEEHEMGDVQFDEESGEGDTMAVERERDLALSSQARQIVADIDAALERIAVGTYGYSVVSGVPIPRDRLEAIPWATELVEEKVGGLGRR